MSHSQHHLYIWTLDSHDNAGRGPTEMEQHMNQPKNAEDFVAFMEEVWTMDCRPDANSGVVLTGSHRYDRYHNAITSARAFGAHRSGGSKLNGQDAAVYRFPADHGLVSVLITNRGDGCKVSYHRFHERGTAHTE